MLTEVANPKLAEILALTTRIRTCANEAVAYKAALPSDDAELVDMIASSAQGLVEKVELALTVDGATSNPSHELSRDERHDMRNSITAVLGFSELLSATYTEPEALISQLEQLKDDSRRFTDLTVSSEG